jgi:hypothetical protein
MKNIALCIVMALGIHSVFAQKTSPSLKLKAYQQSYISGVAPTSTVEIGGKETSPAAATHEPTYYIYLLANKVPYLKIERVWIKNQLYLATIAKVNAKPVVLDKGKRKDTLVKYTDEMVWQVKITGKDHTGITPKKDIEDQVKANELVLRLVDQNNHVFTRTAKQITVLEAERGQ